jgi:hypothetical protein
MKREGMILCTAPCGNVGCTRNVALGRTREGTRVDGYRDQSRGCVFRKPQTASKTASKTLMHAL